MGSEGNNRRTHEYAVKRFLRDYLGKTKDEKTMNSILENIGEYYEADRAYIFEMNDERTVCSNTYEWCREGVSSEIDNLQNISIDGLECWFEAFEYGEFYISSLSEDYRPGTRTYEILEPPWCR